MSAGEHRSVGFPDALLPAIALAGALRTPELLERIGVIAGSAPEEIVEQTGYSIIVAKRGPVCAWAHMERTPPPNWMCDSRWWIDWFDRFPEYLVFSLKARSKKLSE